MFKNYYQSPLGQITLLSDEKNLLGIWFADQSYYGAGYNLEEVSPNLTQPIEKACQWLDDYFAGKNPNPSQVPLAPQATEFRQKVYQLLRQVPYGQTTTYKELSDHLQENQPVKKNLARAVGNAVGHNPILLLIPCHRVLGSDGSLTGYAAGLDRKKALLALEKGNSNDAASDDQWQAIKNNDKTQDHLFWYGVKTTGIFCRPSCPSSLPKQENVVIFSSPQEALSAGFRPCKRCRPTEQFVSNQVWVEEINHVLNSHYREKLTLERLADLVHGSPSYLRHVYKALTGKTPQQKLTAIRLKAAESSLSGSNQSVIQIAQLTGWGCPSYFIQVFKRHYGMTPVQYRKKHSLDNQTNKKGT